MLVENLAVKPILDYSSGSADRNSATVDMAGFDGVLFVCKLEAIAASAAATLKIQGGAQADGSDAVDLENTGVSITDTDANGVKYVCVHQPQEKYLRAVVTKDSVNNTAESIVAYLYDNKEGPVTQDANVQGKLSASPYPGTP